MNKLNLGSGYDKTPGWVHVDKVRYHDQHIIGDVLEGLIFPDDYFDFVLMNHTLQMFTYEELPIVLKEVRRVMKPGATLRILTPDLNRAVIAYYVGNRDYFPISDEIESTDAGKFARYLFWHGDTHCAFTRGSLRDLLERNGFKSVWGLSKFGDCELDSREHESLIMEAIK